MDKPTSLITTLPRLIVGLWLTAVLAGPGHAQNSAVTSDGAFVPEVPATYTGGGSFFNRQLGTAFRFSYHNEGYGTQDGVVSLGSMKVFNQEGSTVFLDGQATLSDEFGGGFNAGIGYRTLTDVGFGFDPLRIHGVNFWTDGQSTEADNFFTQLGVGLESLGDSVDLRFQGYFPLDRIKESDRITVPGSTVVFEENALLGALQQFTRDTALTVLDFEGAKRVANLEAWAFLGGYHLTGSQHDATGYRAGVRGYAVPDVAVSVQVTDDDIYHTNVMFGITWFVGRTHRLNAPCGTLLDRFREPVLRNDFIATTSEVIDDPITPLSDAVSGDQFVFIHVDSSAPAGGNGTFESPYQTLAEAQAGSGENAIIFVHSGSTLAPLATFLFQDGQRLLGEGLDPNGNFIDHTVNSAEQGIVSLPETSPGSQMVAAPTVDGSGVPGSGIVFEMANNNELNNFTINNGETAVNADGVTSPQLANLNINNTTGTAIVFNNVSGNSLIENTVTIDDIGDDPNDRGILITGGSGVLGANATITNTTGRVIEITGRTGGSVTVGQLNQTAGGLGVFVHDNSGGTITFSSPADVTTTGANSAVELTDNSGTTISFQDLRASADDATTFAVTGGGTISVADPNDAALIENTGTGSALVVTGDAGGGMGDPSLTILANVNNGGGGHAVDIQSMTGGAVSITGDVNDPNADGMGILVEGNTAGTFSFAGNTNLDTGANRAVELSDNSDATTSFSNLMATSAAATETVRVEGGGTVDVNDPNDSGFINNTGTGSALVVRGDDFAGTGDPNVTIDADIANSGGGRAVDIQDMTGGGVTINGDVTDTDMMGSGILVQDNTAGTYAFNGNTTLDTGANDAVTLQNNTGATITFSHLEATAEDGNTFSVIGGGTVDVNDPNSVIANTGMGTAVLILGDDEPITADGDPNVTIDAMVMNTVVGFSVDVQFMTAGSVLFTNEIDDMNGGVRIQDNSGTSTINFADTVMVNTNTKEAVLLSMNTDADISFNGLDIVSNGNFTAFSATGGGNLTVTNANDTTIMQNGDATALELVDMTIAAGNVTFDTVDVGLATSDAVILNNLDGPGSVTVGADTTAPGSITTTGDGVTITGGANNITVNSTISIGAGGGRSVDITGRTNGAVTINSTISDDGTGMRIANNTGGSINVTDELTFNTPGDAITIANNNGAAIDFTGSSSIDLGTTAGSGIHLTGTNTNVDFDPNITGGAGTTVEVEGNATATFDGNITKDAGRVIQVHNVTAGTVSFNGDVTNDDVAATGVSIDTNTGGTVNFTGDVTLNTAANDALTITGNSAAQTTTFSAASQLDIDTTSGRGIVISGAGAANILGTGNTVDTTMAGAVGIDITNARSATINNTTINAGDDAVNMVHTNATVSSVTLNNITVESGDIGVDILANGSGQFDVLMDNVDFSGLAQEGVVIDTGAAADRVDFTITDSQIVVGDFSAFRATLDDSATADVRFLIVDNQFTNNSPAAGNDDATVDISVTSGLTLNATVGAGPNDPNDPPPPPIGDRNRFVNTGANGDAFLASINGAGGTLNLDLRDNTAQSGDIQFGLTQTLGAFNLVDAMDTINGLNNVGTVTTSGTINDILPPLLQPTP